MAKKAVSAVKWLSVTLLASSMLVGCSFMDDDMPPRYNTVSGGKRAPALNPHGTGYGGDPRVIPAARKPVMRPSEVVGGGMTSPQSAPVAPMQPAIPAGEVPMATLDGPGLTHQNLQAPELSRFMDAATDEALSEHVGVAPAAPLEPIAAAPIAPAPAPMAPVVAPAPLHAADAGYLPLADVPAMPWGAAERQANAQENISDLQQEATAAQTMAALPPEDALLADMSANNSMPWGEPVMAPAPVPPLAEEVLVEMPADQPMAVASQPEEAIVFPEMIDANAPVEWTPPVEAAPMQAEAYAVPAPDYAISAPAPEVMMTPVEPLEVPAPVEVVVETEAAMMADAPIQLVAPEPVYKRQRMLSESRYAKRYRNQRIRGRRQALQ